MSLIKKMRKQLAIWWPTGPVDEFGAKSFGEPVQITCRWEDREGQFVNPQGFTMATMATVYVDRVMNVGDKLKKGELDSDTPLSPLDDRLAYEVQGFESIPNLKAKEFLNIAHL